MRYACGRHMRHARLRHSFEAEAVRAVLDADKT